jgi:hypothetical protein
LFLAAALAAVALAPTLGSAAGDPPKLGTGTGGPGPATKTPSGLPSTNPGDLQVRPKPDLFISAIGYSAGKITFTVRNQGPGLAGQSKWRMSCQVDPNQPASCAVSYKPTENAGTFHVCPGFVGMSPQEGATPALASAQFHNTSVQKGFKAGCRYKINLETDAGHQVTETNEGNNTNSYILVGQ